MNILIVQTGFLGDVILSSAVFANVRLLYPEAKIVVMTTPQALSLVKNHPAIDSAFAFDKRGKERGFLGLCRMAMRLREESFAKVFSLHKSHRTALLLFLAGIPERFGFQEASLRWLYTARARRADLSHDVLRNLAILRAVGREPDSLQQNLHIELDDDVEAQADVLLAEIEGRKIVGIAPGSVWKTKRWTAEGFRRVAEWFSARDYAVVLIGGPDDMDIVESMNVSSLAGIYNLVGKCTLLVSAAVIARCEVLLSNDSAPLHMASAVGTPVAAVFCATVPTFGYGPWQVRSEVFGVEGLACRPCGRHGGNVCPTGTSACSKELSVKSVISGMERLLRGETVPVVNDAGYQ